MVTALIFAGGVGERMNSRAKPKQFLEIYGKPILIYTIEYFEKHPQIDFIAVVCLEEWIPELEKLLYRNMIEKVRWVVIGGPTGHDSIYNGLAAINREMHENDIVVLHDGVRPLITEELISENIAVVREKGSAITVTNTTESIAMTKSHQSIDSIPNRDELQIIKAPQSFFYKDIWKTHLQAKKDGFKSRDSADLMMHYGFPLYTVESSSYNMKITSPSDYYIFRAIYEARENLQIFGL